jgi:hypothetical protein
LDKVNARVTVAPKGGLASTQTVKLMIRGRKKKQRD